MKYVPYIPKQGGINIAEIEAEERQDKAWREAWPGWVKEALETGEMIKFPLPGEGNFIGINVLLFSDYKEARAAVKARLHAVYGCPKGEKADEFCSAGERVEKGEKE